MERIIINWKLLWSFMLIRWWGIETSESGTMLWKEDRLPGVKKGNEAHDERKVEECYQWKAHGQCSKGDSCSFSHDRLASAQWQWQGSETKKGERLLPHPIRGQNRLTTRKNPHSHQAVNRKALWIRVKFHADSISVDIRHAISGIHPCVWKVVYMATRPQSSVGLSSD